MAKNSSQIGSAHTVIIIGLVIALIVSLGFIFWQNVTSEKNTDVAKQASEVTEKSPEVNAPNNWTEFTNTELGLKFQYPKAWGESKFEVMNPQSDELNETFYKVSFSSSTGMMTIHPRADIESITHTPEKLNGWIDNSDITKHVVTNLASQIVILMPEQGNQMSTLYGTQLVELPKVDAYYVALIDYRTYGSTEGCSHETYTNCYTDDELDIVTDIMASIESM